MIAAYSPQARGRSERSFGTWQGRLPQELRLAGITTVEGANAFLRERYIGEFNGKFSVAAAEKGTAFRRTGRSDLNWIFTRADGAGGGQGQHGGDRGPALADRQDAIPQHAGGKHGNDPRTPGWERSRSASVRTWWGGSTAAGESLIRREPESAVEKAGAWKPAKTKSRFPPAPTLPWKSRRKREIPTFPPRRRAVVCRQEKAKTKAKAKTKNKAAA